MAFVVLFITGFVGLAATWLLGLSHGHAGGVRHAHAALAHRGGHHAALAARSSGGGAARSSLARTDGEATLPVLAPADPGARASKVLAIALRIVSPLNIFGLMLGAGAVGAVCSAAGAGIVASAIGAVVGAIVMRFVVIEWISRVVFHFASQPARNLEGCVLQEVRAVTRFNRRGEGLVRVNIDGHVEDVLARLTANDRKKPWRVNRGDRLIVEEIDTRWNQCVVSRA